MELRDRPIYKYYQEYGKFIHAVLGIMIVIGMVSLNVFLYKDHQLKQEISQTCGWAEEDYECYCLKGEAIALKNQLELGNFELYVNLTDGQLLEHPEGVYNEGWGASNVSLDR